MIAVFALAAAAVTGAYAWRWFDRPARVRAGLPAVPELNARPAILAEKISLARAMVSTRRHLLDGVAELGRLYHANGFLSESEACWQVLRNEQRGGARWCYYLADLHRTASDFGGMESMLMQTVKLAPDYAPAWLQLADYAYKTGRIDRTSHQG